MNSAPTDNTPDKVLILLESKIRAMCDRQSEMLNLLHNIDTSVRNHGECLARHSQWLESHEHVHEMDTKRIDNLSNKVTMFSGVNVAVATIMSAIASWLGSRN